MRYTQRYSPRGVAQPGPMVGAAASFVARLRPPPTCFPHWTRRAFAALAGADVVLRAAMEVHIFISCRGALEK